MQDFDIVHGQDFYPIPAAALVKPMAEGRRGPEDLLDGPRVVVGCDAIYGQGIAAGAFVDQHQLASRFALIFVPASFHGQPDGFHRRLARGQTVSRGIQVQVTGPQAIRAVVAVVDSGEQMRGGDNAPAMGAGKISERSDAGPHSSSRSFM
jgi:hypothetical protein